MEKQISRGSYLVEEFSSTLLLLHRHRDFLLCTRGWNGVYYTIYRPYGRIIGTAARTLAREDRSHLPRCAERLSFRVVRSIDEFNLRKQRMV